MCCLGTTTRSYDCTMPPSLAAIYCSMRCGPIRCSSRMGACIPIPSMFPRTSSSRVRQRPRGQPQTPEGGHPRPGVRRVLKPVPIMVLRVEKAPAGGGAGMGRCASNNAGRSGPCQMSDHPETRDGLHGSLGRATKLPHGAKRRPQLLAAKKRFRFCPAAISSPWMLA
jgi:hypothetical protein